MTTKTTRRNIDIVSKEEWKALVKAQELNRTQLLRSGMGTGTGTGTGTEELSHFYTFQKNLHGELFSFENISWDLSGDAFCVVEVKNGKIVSADADFSYRFSGGNGIGSNSDYNNIYLQGNTYIGSTLGILGYKDNMDDSPEFSGTSILSGIGFSIDGSTTNENGEPINFSYATTTRNIRLSYRFFFDDFTGELSFEPIVKDCGY